MSKRFDYYTTFKMLATEVSSTNVTMAAVLAKMHQIGARNAIPFAMALPKWRLGQKGKSPSSPGEEMQFFFHTQKEAQKAFELLLKEAPVRHFTQTCAPQPVRVGEGVKHYAYVMRRIPNRKIAGKARADKNEQVQKRMQKQLALNQKKRRDYKHLPFIPIKSSSGNSFALIVDRIPVDQPEKFNGWPNGYGLSRKSQMIALPAVS